MKSTTILALCLSTAFESTHGFLSPAFVATRLSAATTTRQPTFLSYSIVYPDDDDDGEAEAQQQKPAPVQQTLKNADGAVASFEGYVDYNEMDEITEVLNVDAYDSMAGGIIPGQQLSALCGDD